MSQALITLKDINLYYNTIPILKDINLQIITNQKIALVGNNRSGKSTLLKILAKYLEPDNGQVIYNNFTKVKLVLQELILGNQTILEFLKDEHQYIFKQLQQYQLEPNQNLFDTLQAKKAFDFEVNFVYLSKLFQFDFTFGTPLKQLSGGQIKKLQIISSLLFEYDLILLDEPTNHLDIEGINMLEYFINNSTSSYLIISHDRQFLDNVTKVFWEIWDKRIYPHTGNYASFLDNKQARLTNEAVIEERKKQYLKRELEWVNAGVQARGTKDKGRLERYYELSDQDDYAKNKKVRIILPEPLHIGARILDVEQLNIYNRDQKVLTNFNLRVNKFDKIGIVGKNGSYKSTFIKAILDQLPPAFRTTGTIKKGLNTNYLYFEQDKSSLDPEMSVFDCISNGLDKISFGEGRMISTYKYLDNWLFSKDQYRTATKNLSGGEKTRLCLAKKLVTSTNFLVLDEPTNDLDLDTILLLEKNLKIYPAPLIIISHDRQFLDQICNIIIAFGHQNNTEAVISYGNYHDYKKKYPNNVEQIPAIATAKNPKIRPKEERKNNAVKRELEKQINRLEEYIQKLNQILIDPTTYNNQEKFAKTLAKKEIVESDYNNLMEEYMILD